MCAVEPAEDEAEDEGEEQEGGGAAELAEREEAMELEAQAELAVEG
jgi:hypothetical protein